MVKAGAAPAQHNAGMPLSSAHQDLPGRAARHAWPVIALHWTSLALVALAFALMEFKSIFPKGSAGRAAMMDWHYSVGLWVWAISALRALVRLACPTPAIAPAPPAWQARLGTAMHGLLYLWLLALPLLGWLAASAAGSDVQALGLALPGLVEPQRALAHDLKEVHEALATAGYGLIGLHALAALYHHFIQRDNTLRLMLPGR